MTKIILNGVVESEPDDGGSALVAEIGSDNDAFFVRLQSWDETKKHSFMQSLEGRKVRIIIETV